MGGMGVVGGMYIYRVLIFFYPLPHSRRLPYSRRLPFPLAQHGYISSVIMAPCCPPHTRAGSSANADIEDY